MVSSLAYHAPKYINTLVITDCVCALGHISILDLLLVLNYVVSVLLKNPILFVLGNSVFLIAMHESPLQPSRQAIFGLLDPIPLHLDDNRVPAHAGAESTIEWLLRS